MTLTQALEALAHGREGAAHSFLHQLAAQPAYTITQLDDAGTLFVVGAGIVGDLDALLNGVPTGATLGQLVDQVRARQSVQIVNLEDGMRINFRASDGERATLHVQTLLDGAEFLVEHEGIVPAMRSAIADYPVQAGLPPVGEEPEQGLDSMGRLP